MAVTMGVKVVAVDALVLVVVLVWMRRKRDGRLEGALRVLLGDAVAQAVRVGSGVQREVQRGMGGILGRPWGKKGTGG